MGLGLFEGGFSGGLLVEVGEDGFGVLFACSGGVDAGGVVCPRVVLFDDVEAGFDGADDGGAVFCFVVSASGVGG